MAFTTFVKVEIYQGKFLYRCPGCGKEFPRNPVREHELGVPPTHDCPKSQNEIQFKPSR
jgi:hypothetical protein